MSPRNSLSEGSGGTHSVASRREGIAHVRQETGLAKQFYGKASDWRLIFQANQDRIKDPDGIQPGWTLTIPEENDDKGGVA